MHYEKANEKRRRAEDKIRLPQPDAGGILKQIYWQGDKIIEQEFLHIVQAHRTAYPQMTAQDAIKLAYQSAMGPCHLGIDREKMQQTLQQEWMQVPADAQARMEPIGNELCRFYLWGEYDAEAAGLLAYLLVRTAEEVLGDQSKLEKNLNVLKQMEIPGIEDFLESWHAKGRGAISHSEIYRATYKPHYRVLKQEYARWFFALLPLWRLVQQKKTALAAIDGRCGSGKTTLAALAEKLFDCRVFHMDDYYLPLEQRAQNWEHTPAGNMDLERFRSQVLEPAKKGWPVQYVPYSCQTGRYGQEKQISPAALTLIEGSYSQHPRLAAYYDTTLFLTCTPEEQAARLQMREGEYFAMFQSRWIPLEEAYFGAYSVPEKADAQFDTTAFLVQEKR